MFFSACKKENKTVANESTGPNSNTTEITPTVYEYNGFPRASDNCWLLTKDSSLVFGGVFNAACFFKTSKKGQLTWWHDYTFGKTGEFCGVAETSTQDLFFCGSTTIGSNTQVLLVKTNSKGDTIWSKTYGSGEVDRGSQIIRTKDDNLLLCGYTYKAKNGFADIYLIKVNQNGDTLWTMFYPDQDQELPFSAIQTQNGEFLITGSNSDNGQPGQVYLLKVGATGAKLWDKKMGPADWYWGRGAVELTTGDLMICGKHTSSGNDNILLIKTDAAGNAYWTKEFGNTDLNEEALSIVKNQDGTLSLTGSSGTTTYNDTRVVFLKVDADGKQILYTTFNDLTMKSGYEIIKDSNDDNILTGVSKSGVFFTRTDKDGKYK